MPDNPANLVLTGRAPTSSSLRDSDTVMLISLSVLPPAALTSWRAARFGLKCCTMSSKLAPGPHNRFGIGVFPGFFGTRQNRIWQHVDYAARYGDIVRHQMGTFVAHVSRHPDHVKHVLQENHANYIKGRGLRKMKVFLGEGLLTSEGDFWRRQRKLIQPAFHRQRLALLASTMAECTAEMLDEWKAIAAGKKPENIAQQMMRLTLNIAAKTLFSVDVRHEAEAVGRALTIALEEGNRRLFTLVELPLWVSTPANVRYRDAMAELDRVVYGIIETRRKTKTDKVDLLGMLIEARDEDTGETMSDKQIRDETMTLFLAGHETTANALSWIWYLLSKHPAEHRKLEREVDEVLGGKAPRFDDLPNLKYTRMVVEESLRLYPPAWIFGRTALGDDTLGGYSIPKRSIVAMSPFLIHRHPEFWSNPEGFDPERFAPEASATRHKYAYVPFGGGPRVCIGNQFAMLESQLCLAMMVQRYRLELVPGARVEMEPLVTLRPLGGMPMTLHERESTHSPRRVVAAGAPS